MPGIQTLMRSAFLVVLLTLAYASTAGAATVRVEESFPGQSGNPQVTIEDTAGDANSVSISYTYAPISGSEFGGDAEVVVRDAGAPLEAGEGCEKQAGGTVRCEVDALRDIEARLGGGRDSATVEPSGEVSCYCVTLDGGDGDDVIASRDGGFLLGGDGNDVLRSEPNPASRVAHPFARLGESHAVGGAGDDVIDGWRGTDSFLGGPGDDTLRGGEGDDQLSGGPTSTDRPEDAAGTDHLTGGPGDDRLDDGDDGSTELGRDVLVGSSGFDSVWSYVSRDSGVDVDLSTTDGDGAPGENDALVNVEMVQTGSGDDRLFGDGDGNFLDGGEGENYLRGRGGDDQLLAEAPARHRVHGDRGNDLIRTRPWARGPFYCGTGDDRVMQPGYGNDAVRTPDRTRNLGPVLASNCEAIGMESAGLAIRPTPKLEGRRLAFRVESPPRRNARYLWVTWATKPFKRVDRTRILESRTASVRLPRWLARRARQKRNGALLRAEFIPQGHHSVTVVWRFRVPG